MVSGYDGSVVLDVLDDCTSKKDMDTSTLMEWINCYITSTPLKK